MKRPSEFSLSNFTHPQVKETLSSLCQDQSKDLEDFWLIDFDYWLITFTKSFVKYRNPKYLSKIIYQLGYLRKELEWQVSKFPTKRHATLVLEPSEVIFPFSRKKIIGCILGIHINPNTEILTEKGISQAFSSCNFDGELLENFYSSSHFNRAILLHYFEIGSSAIKGDLTLFKKNFEEEIEDRVQPLVPSLFMAQNQEEVMRNLITLGKEFQSSTDLPQVTVAYDSHDMESITFNVILVDTKKENKNVFSYLQVTNDTKDHYTFSKEEFCNRLLSSA